MAVSVGQLWSERMGATIAVATRAGGSVEWSIKRGAPDGFAISGNVVSFAKPGHCDPNATGVWVRSITEDDIAGATFIPWCAIGESDAGPGITVKYGRGNGRWVLRVEFSDDAPDCAVRLNWNR